MAKIEIFLGEPTTQERADQIEELILDLNINLETAVIMRTKFLHEWLIKRNDENKNYFDLFATVELNQPVQLPKVNFGVYKHNGFTLPKLIINGFYMKNTQTNKNCFIGNSLLNKLGNKLESEFEFYYYGFKRIGKSVAYNTEIIYYLHNKPHIFHGGEFFEVYKRV